MRAPESVRDEGERLQGLFREAIQRCGQPFVVTPSPARLAAGQAARTIYATVENPNANDVAHLRLEGDANLESPVPVIFTFAGGSGVQENDRLEHDGALYTLLNALPQTYQGVVMGIRCVGIRIRPRVSYEMERT
jgi:hypothetical protein